MLTRRATRRAASRERKATSCTPARSRRTRVDSYAAPRPVVACVCAESVESFAATRRALVLDAEPHPHDGVDPTPADDAEGEQRAEEERAATRPSATPRPRAREPVHERLHRERLGGRRGGDEQRAAEGEDRARPDGAHEGLHGADARARLVWSEIGVAAPAAGGSRAPADAGGTRRRDRGSLSAGERGRCSGHVARRTGSRLWALGSRPCILWPSAERRRDHNGLAGGQCERRALRASMRSSARRNQRPAVTAARSGEVRRGDDLVRCPGRPSRRRPTRRTRPRS